jgi:signal transduction histidine kinase
MIAHSHRPAPREWIAAMVITILIAFLPTLLTRNFPAGTNGVVFGVSGILFLLLGVAILAARATPAPRSLVVGYFAVQLLLLATIFMAGRLTGSTWICGLPLISQALLFLNTRGATVTIGAIIGLTAASIVGLAGSISGLLAASSMLPAFIFVIVFTRMAIRAERLASQLHTANEQLRQQADSIAALATIEERNRVAREIHDSLGHYLTTVAVQIEVASTTLRTEPAQAESVLQKAHHLAQEALVEVRRSVSLLRSATPELPLPERIRALLASTAQAQLAQHLEIHGAPRPASAEAEHTVFRAIQEGLTNVRKHARAARHIRITLDYRNPATLTASLQDDGPGRTSTGGGHGLDGLRERVTRLGGTCSSGNAPDGGFRLHLQLPL